MAELTAADAAAGPVMDMADIAADPHVRGPRCDHRRRRHPDAGPRSPASTATPGVVRWPGRPLNQDGVAIREDGWGRHD